MGRTRAIFLLLLAAITGVVSYEVTSLVNRQLNVEQFENWHGLYREGADSVLRSPMTLNGVTEVASDSDGDGIVDFHSVVIREYEPFRCIYHLSDSDGDQVPDYVTLNLGDASREVIYSQYDGDEDGTVDGQFFALTANTDALDKVVYRDLNFDGWVDMISRKKSLEESFDDPPAVWVLMNGSLHSAREIDTKTDTPRARIASADGEDVWAFFEEGRWRINPDQQ